MCCGGKICMMCSCVFLLVILVGLLFGFGVFKNGFHKIKDTLDLCDSCSSNGRPFFTYPAASPPS